LIPAHEALVPFNIGPGGSYDWDSFNGVDGPYEFWKIINTPPGAITNEDAAHPTKVVVYSDNHGEAMVWLNGDWNLGLIRVDGGTDLEPGSTVGNTTLQAAADYPYIRADKVIFSNIVEKEWTWGEWVLGSLMENGGRYQGSPNSVPSWSRMVLAVGQWNQTSGSGPTDPTSKGTSTKHMVWIWVCDRDGKQAGTLGSQVEWHIMSDTVGVHIPTADGYGMISDWNDTTSNIFEENGFLVGTKRLINPLNPSSYTNADGSIGYSITRDPTPAEKELFDKFYHSHGLDADDFSVAGIEVEGGSSAAADVVIYVNTPREGTITRHTNLDFSDSEYLDDPMLYGDANADGVVNMADVVTVERMILGLAPRDSSANAYWDVNPDGSFNIDMGDAVRIEKIILLGE
jgi:hypothetical protein